MKLKFLEQYKHLGKEIYILFWGRIVTSMGSLIWPLLTLILENKLGYDATLRGCHALEGPVAQHHIFLYANNAH